MQVPLVVTASHPPLDIYNNVEFLQDFSVINIPQSPKETLNQMKGYKMKRQAIRALHYAAQAPNEKSRKFTIKTVFPDFQSFKSFIYYSGVTSKIIFIISFISLQHNSFSLFISRCINPTLFTYIYCIYYWLPCCRHYCAALENSIMAIHLGTQLCSL